MLETFTPDAQAWDDYVRAHPQAHILQLSAWAEHKTHFGWRSTRVGLRENGRLVAGAQVLIRPLPGKLFTMAYVPHGGLVDSDAYWPMLTQAVEQAARPFRAAFIKWEPGLYLDGGAPNPQALGYSESPQTVQPPRTIVLDITGSDEDILARMNQGTRRKIRQSLKAGTTVIEASQSDVSRFCDLMDRTGARNGFGVHTREYYQLAFDLFAPRDCALLLVEFEGEVLAGVMAFAVDGATHGTGWYFYGASSDAHRDKMASYGVQWAAIQWAKARGCVRYDLWGIPDAAPQTLEAEFQSRSDGLWGVYGFKRGWGGDVVRTAGAWDKPLIPPLYWLYRKILARRG